MTRSNFDPVAARLRRHLREMRLRAGLTQAALGERLDHTQQWVFKYEAGERRLDVIEFIQIAHAIGFDPGEFINTFMDGRPTSTQRAPATRRVPQRPPRPGPDTNSLPRSPVPTLTAEALPPRAPRSSRPEGTE